MEQVFAGGCVCAFVDNGFTENVCAGVPGKAMNRTLRQHMAEAGPQPACHAGGGGRM